MCNEKIRKSSEIIRNYLEAPARRARQRTTDTVVKLLFLLVIRSVEQQSNWKIVNILY